MTVKVPDRSWLGMFEVVLPLYVAFLALCVFVFMLNHNLSTQIRSIGKQIEGRLNEPIKVPTTFMDELTENLEDLVHNTISTMQPPNAADHVMGAIAQMIQMKAMQKFGMGPASLNAPEPASEPPASGNV